MIKENTKINREKPASNETETDVQVSVAEREMDGGMVGENTHTHIQMNAPIYTHLDLLCV